MADSDLTKRAKAAGVDIDKRWSDDTLRKEVEKAEKGDLSTEQLNAATEKAEDHARQVQDRVEGGTDPERTEEAAPAIIPQMEVELIRDTWDANGNRQKKGKVISLPMKDAKRAITEGRARFPDEGDD